LRQISSLIGSRHQDHNHVYVAVVFGVFWVVVFDLFALLIDSCLFFIVHVQFQRRPKLFKRHEKHGYGRTKSTQISKTTTTHQSKSRECTNGKQGGKEWW
jgi:hypothetical protein